MISAPCPFLICYCAESQGLGLWLNLVQRKGGRKRNEKRGEKNKRGGNRNQAKGLYAVNYSRLNLSCIILLWSFISFVSNVNTSILEVIWMGLFVNVCLLVFANWLHFFFCIICFCVFHTSIQEFDNVFFPACSTPWRLWNWDYLLVGSQFFSLMSRTRWLLQHFFSC